VGWKKKEQTLTGSASSRRRPAGTAAAGWHTPASPSAGPDPPTGPSTASLARRWLYHHDRLEPLVCPTGALGLATNRAAWVELAILS